MHIAIEIQRSAVQ